MLRDCVAGQFDFKGLCHARWGAHEETLLTEGPPGGGKDVVLIENRHVLEHL